MPLEICCSQLRFVPYLPYLCTPDRIWRLHISAKPRQQYQTATNIWHQHGVFSRDWADSRSTNKIHNPIAFAPIFLTRKSCEAWMSTDHTMLFNLSNILNCTGQVSTTAKCQKPNILSAYIPGLVYDTARNKIHHLHSRMPVGSWIMWAPPSCLGVS